MVFLGYGLPGTDETAKDLLLQNIAGNLEPLGVSVHVVLGREVDRPDVRRLVALLSTIAPAGGRSLQIDGARGAGSSPRNLAIWRHAMGSEDFIPRAENAIRAKRESRVGKAPCLI